LILFHKLYKVEAAVLPLPIGVEYFLRITLYNTKFYQFFFCIFSYHKNFDENCRLEKGGTSVPESPGDIFPSFMPSGQFENISGKYSPGVTRGH